MNRKMIFHTVGRVVFMEAGLLMLPLLVSLLYREPCAISFVYTIAIALAVGFVMELSCRGARGGTSIRDGFIIVSLAWLFLSAIGALPFVFSRQIPSYVDALFETISGFTTTGASILTDVEAMSRGLLFWRSFTHWVGGMGILVFVIMLTKAPDRSINILKAEMPGPVIDKLVPKSQDTARILYTLYMGLTVIEIVFLLCGGMSLYESIVHTFGTAGTGGFGIKADSIGSYSPYLQWVIAIFMLLFGINFNLYYVLLLHRAREFFKNAELRLYLALVLVAAAVITVNILPLYHSFSEALRLSVFQVSSIITTTGYATADFNLWPSLSKAVLLLLMFVGGCAGSTAGGLKVSRVLLLYKMIRRELRHALHPRAVEVITVDGRRMDDQTLSGVGVYLALYMLCMAILFGVISFEPFDLETNLSAVVSCFNNIGPGLGAVGPAGSFAAYTPFTKLLLSAGMLLGRLEIYPLLLAVSPSSWRRR